MHNLRRGRSALTVRVTETGDSAIKRRKRIRFDALLLSLGVTGAALPPIGSVHLDPSGVTVSATRGAQRWVRLEVYDGGAIRVTEAPSPPVERASLMVIANPVTSGFTVRRSPDSVTLATARMAATVALADGLVTVRDLAGRTLLAETGNSSFVPVTQEGQPFLALHQQWNRSTNEGFYGLGQHQNRQMNYLGQRTRPA